ncbi:chromate efflux transporter [Rhodovulum sp. YNF3179]|uniref:chromate efflux transporter n=1 Tax=Rhodovulum sp. YNF3179 TaxID=3425127 RepID=UPI003D355C78
MTETRLTETASTPAAPGFGAALRVWARIGVLSFGGPAGQIALMHREVVEERGWLGEDEFLNALSFSMLLPGPEAMQLATYAGWRLHGVAGGLAAGLLFVLPGAAVVLALAALYAAIGAVPLVQALFLGVKAAVVVIVIEALLKVARRALKEPDRWMIAALAFVAIFFLSAPFPLIVALAALYGLLRGGDAGPAAPPVTRPLSRTLGTILLWLAVWWAPLAVLWLAAPGSLLVEIGLFFSKLAVVTFGGAYAVLAYMAQDVVNAQGWLTAGEMMDGLGLAETTPGPLILVTEFVGFLAAEKAGGLALGLAGAAVTLWMTFAPCFLWIFAGAPYVAVIATRPRLKAALSAITAAVVGVILNLSIWFALHVFFGEVTARAAGPFTLWTPDWATLDPGAVLLALVAGVLLLWLRLGLIAVLGISALLGVAWALIAG